ncbi:NADH-ubiquinone oxidoreductase 9.5 kDa subunit, partial [Lachnellula suecica]
QSTMSAAAPRFFSQPIRYLRWAAIEKPAIFFSLCIGTMGPVTLLVVPPIRHRFGDPQRPQIPFTYPIPSGPRKNLSGYDD